MCGLIQSSSAMIRRVFDGAIAMPFDPRGSWSSCSYRSRCGSGVAADAALAVERLRALPRFTFSMSPPMLPSLKVSAIHGSKCVMHARLHVRMLVRDRS